MSEKRIIDETTGGEKNQKDVRIHAIPWEGLEELGRIYTFGEEKYADYNFRKGYKWSLSFDAMQRHPWIWWSGQDVDDESGLHHLAHATWHGLTLLLFALTGKGTDDRPGDSLLVSRPDEDIETISNPPRRRLKKGLTDDKPST